MADQPDRVKEVTPENDYRHSKKGGYVKMWRSVDESSLATMPHIDQVLFWRLVRNANWKKTKFFSRKLQKDIWIERGQLVITERGLAKELNSDRSAVKRSLTRLEKSGKISPNTEPGFTIITLCNYEYYNDGDLEPDQESDQGQTKDEPRTDLSKEVKKYRKKDITPNPDQLEHENKLADLEKLYIEKVKLGVADTTPGNLRSRLNTLLLLTGNYDRLENAILCRAAQCNAANTEGKYRGDGGTFFCEKKKQWKDYDDKKPEDYMPKDKPRPTKPDYVMEES